MYFISTKTLLFREIDGKIIIGENKEKEVAKKRYEAAKRRGESVGYIGTRSESQFHIDLNA